MKNKMPLLIVGGVVLLVIAGYFLFMRNGSSPLMGSSPEEMVANALSGSGSVKCEYDEGESHIVAYMKDGKIRSDVTGGADGSMSMIYKDTTSWTWNPETKEGMVYKAPEVTPMDGEEFMMEEDDEMETMNDTEEMKAEIEEYKESCKNESIADSMFEAPSDVTFVDYSEMMEQQMQSLPAEYQQMMQQ